MSKTLREIYEYDLIEDDGIDYTVDEWFNTIMEKTKDQLNVSDVSRMLRQKICSRLCDRMVGKVGVEPTEYQSHGFTVRCNRHYAYLPIRLM